MLVGTSLHNLDHASIGTMGHSIGHLFHIVVDSMEEIKVEDCHPLITGGGGSHGMIGRGCLSGNVVGCIIPKPSPRHPICSSTWIIHSKTTEITSPNKSSPPLVSCQFGGGMFLYSTRVFQQLLQNLFITT